ncbi:MAG: hypothetical protein H6605_02805 [Flavobacteriales bacterium]|nr:hypothetical protein [Flavobacteriales bacterium]
MNLIKISICSTLLFTSVASCTFDSNSEVGDKNSKEYTSAYVCPMHCEGSGSDTAGQCQVCGMDYVKNNTK